MIELFDSHCHVDEARFDADREETLARMRERGVTRFAVIGSDMASSRHAADFAASHEGCWAAVGVHPHEAKTWKEGDDERLAAWVKEEKVAAIGEIGLDYYYDLSPRSIQQEVCLRQMELAWQLDMPVCYHVRDAHQDMLELMKSRKGKLSGGIIHCFSGSWEIAREYLKLGFYISFAGPVTFKKAPKLQEAALNVPIERLLVETDSPYLAPKPVRGRRNEPANVYYVAEKIAALRGIPLEEFAAQTTRNALAAYRIG
ncbi:MAG: TatD family hydrolase [Aristaeellaceae bacterium]